MKNKLFFKIMKFLRKLGIKPSDIAVDTGDEKQMSSLAITIFSAVLATAELEDEYYKIVSELFDCNLEDAEEIELMAVFYQIVISIKSNTNFSGGVLKNTK